MLRTLCLKEGAIEKHADFASIEAELKSPHKRIWIDIEAPKKDELEFLEKTLGLHPLMIEDIANERQRPKVEPYENCLYVVLKIPQFDQSNRMMQLNAVLGPNYLVTVRSKPLNFLEDTWQRAEKNPALLGKGPDFILYSILDLFVDALFPKISELDAQLDSASEKVFTDPSPAVLAKLFTLKKGLFSTRRAITPMRDVLTILARHDTTLINRKNSLYFRDVYDHMTRIVESLDNAREMVTSAMEGYMSSVSNNLNVIMKKLTAITAIIMVPSMIAGIYGMNFPDLALYEFGGTTAALLMMGGSVLVLGIYFKWRGWL